MSREIKFRAWDKVEDIMIYVDEIIWHIKYLSGTHKRGGTTGKFKDYILMQYTGLKDKNGKEIYEGDILEWHEDIKEIVDFYEGSFYVGKRIFGVDVWSGDFEIIGNIYENKDLLE